MKTLDKKKAVTKPANKSKGGRPSIYTDAIVEKICSRIAVNGESLRTICKDAAMPGFQTVLGWLANEDSEKYESFRTKYARAREIQGDKFAEEIIEISDEIEVEARHDGEEVILDLSTTAVARNRLRIDARKWYASKLAPKKYGDRIDAHHSGPDGGNIPVSLAVSFVATKK